MKSIIKGFINLIIVFALISTICYAESVITACYDFDNITSLPSYITMKGQTVGENIIAYKSDVSCDEKGGAIWFNNYNGSVYVYADLLFEKTGAQKGDTVTISYKAMVDTSSEIETTKMAIHLYDESLSLVYSMPTDTRVEVKKDEWTYVEMVYEIADTVPRYVGIMSFDTGVKVYADSILVSKPKYKVNTSFYKAFSSGFVLDEAKSIDTNNIYSSFDIESHGEENERVNFTSVLFEGKKITDIKSKTFDIEPYKKVSGGFLWNFGNDGILSDIEIKSYILNTSSLSPYTEVNSLSPAKEPVLPEVEKIEENLPEYSEEDVLFDDTSIFSLTYNQGIYGEDYSEEYALYFGEDNYNAEFTYRDINDVNLPFNKALRVNVPQISENATASAIRLTIDLKNDTIKDGDILLLSFYAKAYSADTDQGSGIINLVYEENYSPFSKPLTKTVYASYDWKKYYAAFQVSKDYLPDASKLMIQFGSCIQDVIIGGLELINYKTRVTDLNDLPSNSYDYYNGMEEDAEWRSEAAARIEEHRKGDFSVVVKDANGNTVNDANIYVKQTGHEFDFGGALYQRTNTTNVSESTLKLFEIAKKHFNTVVIANALKWPQWEAYQSGATETAKWVYENGFKLRGHALVWDSLSHMPDDLADIKDDETAVRERINGHITSIVGTLADYVEEWDVLNEPVNNYNFRSKFGTELVKEWFAAARENDPTAKLYVNETNIVGYDQPSFDKFINILTELENLEVDYDAIGIQGHFGVVCDVEYFYKQLCDIAEFGKEIKITEFSMRESDEMQAHFVKDILTICFSHPSVNGFVMWNYFTGSGDDSAVMYYNDMTLKPAGEQIVNLIENEWTTSEIGKTDQNGKYSSRGFYGDYKITVEKDGVSKAENVTLSKDNANEFVVTLN